MASHISDRRRLTASYVFIGVFLFTSVVTPTHKLAFKSLLVDSAIMGFLVLSAVPFLYGKALLRTAGTGGALIIMVLLYSTMRQGSPQIGTTDEYLGSGIKVAIYITLVAAFIGTFYDQTTFLKAFWNMGRLFLVIALAGYVFAVTTGRVYLASADRGTRLQGTVSEPSACAAPLAAVLLLALSRKNHRVAVLAALAAILTRSPIVIFVVGASLPVYYLTHRDRFPGRKFAVVILLTVAAPVLIYRVERIDPTPYLQSSGTKLAIGRLIGGINEVRNGQPTNSGPIINARLTGGLKTVDEVRANHWQFTGYGLGSSAVYLQKKYNDTEAWSLFYAIIFDYGYFGAGALVFLMGLALARMRNNLMMSILLPFFVASMINSAEGWIGYKFVILGIMLFAFRWVNENGAFQRSHILFAPSRTRPERPILVLPLPNRRKSPLGHHPVLVPNKHGGSIRGTFDRSIGAGGM